MRKSEEGESISGACLTTDYWRLATGSESDSEPELHHSRLIRDVRIRRGLSIEPVAFNGRVRAVVGVVEHVEHFHDAVDAPVAAQREVFLQPEIEAVNRVADNPVARREAAAGAVPDDLKNLRRHRLA